jgi:alkylhydroperoxidase family enzyme
VSDAELAELATHAASRLFDARTRVALELTDAMTETPPRVDDRLYARAREHFDETELVELSATIAWENFRARFNRTFRVPADGFSEGGYCVLPA